MKLLYVLLLVFPFFTRAQNSDSLKAALQHYTELLPNPAPDPAQRQISRLGRIYKVIDRYADGKPAAIRYAEEVPEGSFFAETGASTEFYPNGKLRRSRTPEGDSYRIKEHFSNGELYREYLERGVKREVIMVLDINGHVLVNEGNGQAVEMERYEEMAVLETGNYESGYRTGEWQGYTDRPYFVETYKAGLLVSGESQDENGKKFRYKQKHEPIVFKGGEQQLYSFLGQNLDMPRDLPADEKVRVNTQFWVNREGKIDSLGVLNKALPSATREALRVVKATDGKWLPGKLHGQPVKMLYTLPIVFVLNN